MVAAEHIDVEAVAFAPDEEHAGGDDRRTDAEQLLVDGIERSEGIGLGDGKFLRVYHALQQRRKAAEQNAENHPYQYHPRQIASALFHQDEKQQHRAAHHRDQFEAELARRRQLRVTRAAEGKHEQRLQKDVQRIEAEDGGSENRIVGQRLEKHGRHAHRIGHRQQRGEFAQPQRQHEIPVAARVQREEQGARSQQQGGRRPQRPAAALHESDMVFRRHGRASSAITTKTELYPLRRTRRIRGFQTETR